MRVVVIGGTGNFGTRICRRLGQESGLEIIPTARHARPGVVPLDLSHADFAARLTALAPQLVVHCAGPYQGQDYRVARAALAAGAHYLDLADGRDFVSGFAAAIGAAALAAQRCAVSGASTLPALSSAVVDQLLPQFSRLDSIDIVIAPGQQAPRGAATLAGVFGYAGRAFRWWRGGSWQTAHGWQEIERRRFSFGTRVAAACDVPDLELFPGRYPGVRDVTFRAALEVSVQHYALWLVAALRRIGVPLPIERWAPRLDRCAKWLDRFGSSCGGMSVELGGTGPHGEAQRVRWEIVARDNHGPEIPCMAAVLLACRIARGEAPPPGAHACMGLLGLQDFAPEFARWDMGTSIEVGA